MESLSGELHPGGALPTLKTVRAFAHKTNAGREGGITLPGVYATETYIYMHCPKAFSFSGGAMGKRMRVRSLPAYIMYGYCRPSAWRRYRSIFRARVYATI